MASAVQQAKGFSLVELAIVLVIIGLITGGILTGQELIRASELNSVASDYNKVKTAINTFQLKYNAQPGDITNATSYWGTNAGCLTSTAGTGTQTCNGNGDGSVTNNVPGATQEQFMVWQHLANAGLWSGSYTGVSTTAYTCTAANCPTGKISGMFYWVGNLQGTGGNAGTNGWWWADAGKISSFAAGANDCAGYPGCPIVTPAELASMDSKYDDGRPAMGVWRDFGGPGIYTSSCAINATSGAALTNSDGTKALANNAAYNLSNSAKLCSFEIFLK